MTTAVDSFIEKVYDRMPVILDAKQFEAVSLELRAAAKPSNIVAYRIDLPILVLLFRNGWTLPLADRFA
jgi:hypothetical protein